MGMIQRAERVEVVELSVQARIVKVDLLHPLQISACAKSLSLSGQHQSTQSLHLPQSLTHLTNQFHVQRVVGLGSIQIEIRYI